MILVSLKNYDPIKFDTLNVEELKAVVEYIVAQYKATCAKNAVSGTHVDFSIWSIICDFTIDSILIVPLFLRWSSIIFLLYLYPKNEIEP